MALSILPPTLIIPSSSIKSLKVLNSPFFIRLLKSFWTFLIHEISAFFSSSGMRGPSRALIAFLLRPIFSANRLIKVVTRISFHHLEKFLTSVTFPTPEGVTALTVLINVTMLHIFRYSVAVWTGHCSSGSFRNSGPFIQLPYHPLRFLYRECASIHLDPNYSGYPQSLQRQIAWNYGNCFKSMRVCYCCQWRIWHRQIESYTLSLSFSLGGRQERLLAIPDVELLAALGCHSGLSWDEVYFIGALHRVLTDARAGPKCFLLCVWKITQ